MTVLIQQKSNNDCGLAAIAMSVHKEKWEDLWNEEDLKELEGKGMSDYEPWLTRANLNRHLNYRIVYNFGMDPEKVADLLTWRRALVSIRSLNDVGNHLVYWDGERVWDPQEGREGKNIAKSLRSVVISTVIVLKD